MKLEYDYLDFANAGLTTPASFSTTPAGIATAIPSADASVRQDTHEVTIGLNYKLGTDPWSNWGLPVSAMPMNAPPRPVSGWAVETGGRYWYSSGQLPERPSRDRYVVDKSRIPPDL